MRITLCALVITVFSSIACGAPAPSDTEVQTSIDSSSHPDKWCVFCKPTGGSGGDAPSGDGWGTPSAPQPGDPTANDPTGSGGNGTSPGASGGGGVGGGGGGGDPAPGPSQPGTTYPGSGQVLPGTPPPSAGGGGHAPTGNDPRAAAQCRARCQTVPVAQRADCLSEC